MNLHSAKLSDATRVEVLDGLTVKLIPAGLGRRAMAFAIDCGIVGAISYLAILPLIFFGVSGAVFSHAVNKKTSSVVMLIVALVITLCLMALAHAYFIYQEYKKGTTFGKTMLGLRVVSLEGGRPALKQCVQREMFKYIDLLFGIPALLSISFTRGKQRVGDLMAGTLVIHSPEEEAAQEHLYVSAEDYDLYREVLQPEVPTREQTQEYLSLAFHWFVLRDRPLEAGDVSEWVSRIQERCGSPKIEGSDPASVLRFYAEHCFQTQRQLERSQS